MQKTSGRVAQMVEVSKPESWVQTPVVKKKRIVTFILKIYFIKMIIGLHNSQDLNVR
jgi:hypothetical protein